jgi:hypothetical protein
MKDATVGAVIGSLLFRTKPHMFLVFRDSFYCNLSCM